MTDQQFKQLLSRMDEMVKHLEFIGEALHSMEHLAQEEARERKAKPDRKK